MEINGEDRLVVPQFDVNVQDPRSTTMDMMTMCMTGQMDMTGYCMTMDSAGMSTFAKFSAALFALVFAFL